MAKQTFTTGQVLTAAQMTSLQQTAMGGGSPSTKTASYVLVAADAGTVIQMNSASSTTITVNTALFSAGDSVQIQNIGAGVCTITAGTATVNTAGSLALSQWEGGFLYFTSASSAIFFDVVQSSGMTNPMTTAGDTIYGGASGTPTRLAIGSTGQVLTVSGGNPIWASASSGALTLVSTTTIGSGVSSVTVSNAFSSTYDNYKIIISGGSASAAGTLRMQLGTTTTGYYFFGLGGNSGSSTVSGDPGSNDSSWVVGAGSTNSLSADIEVQCPNLAKRTVAFAQGIRTVTPGEIKVFWEFENSDTQHTAFTIFQSTNTLTGGTIKVYGYANS